MILAQIRNLLMEQPFAAELGTYDFGDGTQRPSVHVTDPLPDNAGSPMISVLQEGGSEESVFDSRAEIGIQLNVEIKVWGDQEDSEKRLRSIAHDVHELFFNGSGKRFQAQDWFVCHVTASPPKKLTDQDEFPGFAIALSMHAIKERVR